MIETIARCIWRELGRLESDEDGDWRRLILRKVVHRVPQALQPMPDGLSRRYVEIGRLMNEASARDTAARRSPLLAAIEAMVEDEVAEALLNEHDLLAEGAAP